MTRTGHWCFLGDDSLEINFHRCIRRPVAMINSIVQRVLAIKMVTRMAYARLIVGLRCNHGTHYYTIYSSVECIPFRPNNAISTYNISMQCLLLVDSSEWTKKTNDQTKIGDQFVANFSNFIPLAEGENDRTATVIRWRDNNVKRRLENRINCYYVLWVCVCFVCVFGAGEFIF